MTEAPAGAPPVSLSHLLIHAEAGTGAGRGVLAGLLQRLHASAPQAMSPLLPLLPPAQRPRPPAGVRIDDLQGRHFFAAQDARSLIDVSLPAGTYHVTVQMGHFSRRYTVTLTQGSTMDLHLPLPTAAADRA